jgi:hypothetical protein
MSDSKKPKSNRRRLIIVGLVVALIFLYKNGQLNTVLEKLNLPVVEMKKESEMSPCSHDCAECEETGCNECQSCPQDCACKE